MYSNYDSKPSTISYGSAPSKKVLEILRSVTNDIDNNESIREIDYRSLFDIMNRVYNNWSVYYRYRDLMDAYYKLYNKVSQKDENNFDKGAIYGVLSICQRYLDKYLREYHRSTRIAVKDISKVSKTCIPRKLRRTGIRYQVTVMTNGHGRYSSLGEGKVVETGYYCNATIR